MFEVTSITNKPRQNMQIALDNNETVDFTLYFLPTQYSWYFDFVYKDYVCNGNKVVLTYNALRHLRNRLPFGISFVTDGGKVEPFSVEDFASGRIKMMVLDAVEVQEVEDLIYYGN